MTTRALSIFVGLAALLAPEARPQDAQDKGAPAPSDGVRRFSVGGVLSFSAFSLIKDATATSATTDATTKPKGSRFGGGILAQVAFADRFAAAGQVLFRRARFETNSEIKVSNGTTKQQDFSSADFVELPFTLRRYSHSHAESGARWFAEGGLALRHVRNIRSSLQTTDTTNKTVCCDERPIPAQNSWSTGATFGLGYQLVDQFGLRLVPYARYTRWLQSAFDRQSVRSDPNQLEAGVAITF
ncbi:MAG: PorT family protein [Bryobacteraceae bacterium]|nr:PorT family protein [Bryobacteraceae bacterium]